MQNTDVHYAGDGLGPRDVFVNGNPINYVVYANPAKGVVEFAPLPLRVKRTAKSIPGNCVVTSWSFLLADMFLTISRFSVLVKKA
ncbi:hypothetical protein [Klebsiella michiganensis]|uniref:hypothetical protein n=1 Tax=Klebsiella michiganensis TaxID=1134687 RepID=UPI00244D3C36|nr:hypothetical protein [Klebsiella michiganensis]MDH1759612.1 hypothetical protein [Klebsiella michiganensis]